MNSFLISVTVILLLAAVPRIINAYENDNNDEEDQQQRHHEVSLVTNRLNTDVEAEQVALLARCSTELVALQSRVSELEEELLEQQQASSSASTRQSTAAVMDHFDDASVLELFMMTCKEKLLQSVPPTDAECGFDLITGKCTPSCRCAFLPKWGDYSPARACRLKPSAADGVKDLQCDPNIVETPWAVKLMQVVGHHAGRTMKQVKAKLVEMAPPTHDDCRFSFKSIKCEPSDLCIWDFHPGDFTLDRACRYRVDKLD